MTLTTNGLNYIAQNFGSGDCFASSGLSWRAVAQDGTSTNESGGSKNIAGRLINDTVYARIELTSPRTGSFTKAQLISANDGQSITLVDINNASDSYCYTATTNGNGTGEPSMDARVGTYEFTGAFCTGAPTGGIVVPDDVTMHHTHSLVLNKKWFEINGVEISNTSACLAYFAVEMRMWSGTHSYCPTTSPAWKGMNRNVEEEFIRNIPIDVMKTEDMFLDFLIPDIGTGAGQLPAGTYTICLYVWANFSKYDLQNELEAVGYTNPEN